MSTPHATRPAARTIACSLAVAIASAIAGGAASGAPHEAVLAAEAAFRAGDAATAHATLLDWVVSDPRDAESLLAAAELASEMRDADLLERLQGAGETAGQGGAGPELDVAVATACLGLAEARLARQETGSSLAFLFADAEAKARRAATGPTASAARRLLARSRWAQGDLEGALAVLQESPDAPTDGRLLAFHGRLLYERATSRGLDGRGYPTEAGRADLEAARDLLAAGVGAGGLRPPERGDALLAAAWAAHRLGALEDARDLYVRARLAAPASPLPLRGLASLCEGRPAEAVAAFADLVRRAPRDRGAWDALAEAHRAAGDPAGALTAAQRRIDLAPEDPAGWVLAAGILAGIRQATEAQRHYERALELDPAYAPAAAGLEALAVDAFKADVERGSALYESLLRLRPTDPFVRNNYGFLLREAVSPWTTSAEDGTQRLKPDAPPRVGTLLVRSRDVYLEACGLIPEAEDGRRAPLEDWDLAGIVNDAGLMLHYFEDIRDGPRAEALYLRAFRMTDGGFKDTYVPNLQRLYGHVLPDRELAWYRAARRAKDAVMRETTDERGAVTGLVPDEAKREAAARDELALRARLVRDLRADAESDGAPWPPAGEDATGR